MISSLARVYWNFDMRRPVLCIQKKIRSFSFSRALLVVFLTLLVSACTPRVEVAVPEKPITINLNVKIDHEVRVKVEKDLEEVFAEDSDLF